MQFKNEKNMLLFTSLHPLIIMIYADLNWYAKSRHYIDLTITETITTKEEDERLNRTSSSHRECRALDVRTKGIDTFIVADLVEYINNKPEYKRFHYLSGSGQKRLAYWHNSGHGDHIHLSINAVYAFKK